MFQKLRTPDSSHLAPQFHRHRQFTFKPTCQLTHALGMWITLFFIAQVGGEWVQISQQHYRKPYRPYNHPALAEDTDSEYEDDTTRRPNRIYANQSVNDYKWKDSDLPFKKGFVTKVDGDHIRDGDNHFNKEVHNNAFKNTNIGHSEDYEDVSDAYTFEFNHHGQLTSNKETVNDKRTKIPHKYPEKEYDHNKQEIAHNHPKKHGPVLLETEDVFEEPYHMVPSIGGIKRVHIDSRTVRTPILKEISKKEAKPTHNIKPPINENYNKDKETIPRPIIVWKGDNQTKKIVPGIIQKVSKEELISRQMKNISRYEEIILDDEQHSKIKDIFMPHVVQSDEGLSGETVKFNQLPDINFDKPVFLTKEEFNDDELVTIASDITENTDEKTTESSKKVTTETPKSKSKVKDKPEETPVQEKVNTMENVLKFMKIVTDTISRNTRRSVGSKVRYLENLQDTIMANIAQRIDTMWPDDADEKTPGRRARSAASPRGGGHVEFPSSESALMTISFLTFAVYLIKLVLQVIHTYKNKAMMLTPAVVTAVGRNVVYRRADNT